MSRTRISSLKLVASSGASTVENDRGRTTVSLHGEHDASTSGEVSEALARAIALGDSDLVVDLSDVGFMGVATVGVITRAGDFLNRRQRALVIRTPSSSAQRVLKLCGFAQLLEWAPEVTHVAGTAGALATWIEVPTAERNELPSAASPAERVDFVSS